MGDYYIGLISGTSMDGIDAALVDLGEASVDVLQTHSHDYPAALRQELGAAALEAANRTFDDVAALHHDVGVCFRNAALMLLRQSGVDASAVVAIGSHGQTVRHEPDATEPYSLQIGDPEIIAAGTGIATVADFRSADIALGGQGAPLAPAFHEWLFRERGVARVVLNIGGIANVTILPADDGATSGFDTGPGNTLLDAWVRRHQGEPFDRDGAWSASGSVAADLLARLLADDYFRLAPPKSTGFEYFNLEWLDGFGVRQLQPADVQATLCQLTAASIADAIRSATTSGCEVLVCGGGVHNADLMRRLAALLPDSRVASSATAGLDPDWVEAVAFAWLARETMAGRPGNLPAVTGAVRPTVLGTIHHPD